jgi:hypothetical protein
MEALTQLPSAVFVHGQGVDDVVGHGARIARHGGHADAVAGDLAGGRFDAADQHALLGRQYLLDRQRGQRLDVRGFGQVDVDFQRAGEAVADVDIRGLAVADDFQVGECGRVARWRSQLDPLGIGRAAIAVMHISVGIHPAVDRDLGHGRARKRTGVMAGIMRHPGQGAARLGSSRRREWVPVNISLHRDESIDRALDRT